MILLLVAGGGIAGGLLLSQHPGPTSNVATTPDVTTPHRTLEESASLRMCPFRVAIGEAPTGWDRSLRPGDGGGGSAGDPAVVGHWPGSAPGIFVRLLRPDNGVLRVGVPSGATTAEPVAVLGTQASLEDIHDGYGVAIVVPDSPPCGLLLAGYGITRSELRSLAESMYTTEDTGAPTLDDRGTLWPDDTEPARSALARGNDTWRLSAEQTALAYGRALFRAAIVSLGADGAEPSEDGRLGTVYSITDGQWTASVKVAPAVGRRWYSAYEATVPYTLNPNPNEAQRTACPLVFDVSGRRWIADSAANLDNSANADGTLVLVGDRAELRTKAGTISLRVAGGNSGERCGY